MEKVIELPKQAVSEDLHPEIGMQMSLTGQKGNHVPAYIVGILEESIKVDLNHPLAGLTLLFEIEVVETELEPDSHEGCGCGSESEPHPHKGCGHDHDH